MAGRAPLGVTPRRVLWLISQFPESSAYAASEKGGAEHRTWTAELVLLAGIFNALQGANYQRANGKGKKPKPVEPPPIRRRRGKARGRSRAAAHIARGVAQSKRVATPTPAPKPPVQRGGLGVPAEP